MAHLFVIFFLSDFIAKTPDFDRVNVELFRARQLWTLVGCASWFRFAVPFAELGAQPQAEVLMLSAHTLQCTIRSLSP